MQKPRHEFTRWYDSYENIRVIMAVTEHFPTIERHYIAQKFHNVITQHGAQGYQLDMGSEKVLSLYKSKSKKRWYDKIYSFHSSLNSLMTLPDTEIALVSEKCKPVKDEVIVIAKKLGLDLDEILPRKEPEITPEVEEGEPKEDLTINEDLIQVCKSNTAKM